MTDISSLSINSNLVTQKLENALDNLSLKLRESSAGSIVNASNEIYKALDTYFKEIGDAEFNPSLFLENDTPRSSQYNQNLVSIHNDISRFYDDLKNLSSSYVKSYNYSQVVNQNILSRAQALASLVVDLNILNEFDRGDVIVAGDSFDTLEYIDQDVGLGSDQAELLPGGGGLSLVRDSAISVIDSTTKVEIVPLAPVSENNSVNSEPTIGNLERFYEGSYYGFFGQARPEGGEFNFKTLQKLVTTPGEEDPAAPKQLYTTVVDLGASAENKSKARRRMFDLDPATFWECEYVYKSKSDLLSPNELGEEIIDPEEEAATPTLSIDVNQANAIAKQLDEVGRDLIIDIIITFPETKSINFVSLNPVLFSPDAYPEILDISTSNDEKGEFSTIDGWNSLKFPRFLTPEANEFLTDSQQSAILAPNRTSFKGQGIFNFPVRQCRKAKIRVKVDAPVNAPYERVYALLTNNTKTTSTITTTTTRRKLF